VLQTAEIKRLWHSHHFCTAFCTHARTHVGLRVMWTLTIIPFALNCHMLRVHPRRLESSMSTMSCHVWPRLCNIVTNKPHTHARTHVAEQCMLRARDGVQAEQDSILPDKTKPWLRMSQDPQRGEHFWMDWTEAIDFEDHANCTIIQHPFLLRGLFNGHRCEMFSQQFTLVSSKCM
jgi:hypothetical protein